MCSLTLTTGLAVRLASRRNEHSGPTTGAAPGHVQANLIVLPSRYADDFRLLCARNPVPCPLLAESVAPGVFDAVQSAIPNTTGDRIIAHGCDLRRDIPLYMIYKDSTLKVSHCSDIMAAWTTDHVGFLIGCSYSFETELVRQGLAPRQIIQGRNVPMYRASKRHLCPAGVFTGGAYVVSMRPYKRRDVERVRAITRRFGLTHGEPIAWGWEALEELGIRNVDEPEWGDGPLTITGRPFGEDWKRQRQRHVGSREATDEDGDEDEEVPVFWGCGVTPQEAVMAAGLEGTVMAHAPGYMLVLDLQDEDICK